ncbi:hypothetical protein NP493_1891g00006 [Ridgeia piscesae]|uniref:Uncharacterized protein n=1 Tax=Ridgeia piscesae TaxID=27915 RepID=A0AAD9JRH9_RIDPI|nr:hypothetical protein NP493_1891g00006 [Ridgeia piscesae]
MNIKLPFRILTQPTCDYMAYGEATLSVGGRPGQPRGYSYLQLFSVTRLPDWNSQREWFLFSSEGDVRSMHCTTVARCRGPRFDRAEIQLRICAPCRVQLKKATKDNTYEELSHVPASLVQQNSPYGAPPPQPMNYGQPAGFGQDTNAGTGMIMGAAALGMGAGMMGVPFINPGMSDIGGTMGGMDLF